jgi:hypothetical protein
MVRTTGARRQTYDVVSNRAVEVDRAIRLRARVHKPRNIPLGVNVNKVHLKVMLIAKRMQNGSGFFDSHAPPLVQDYSLRSRVPIRKPTRAGID